MFSVELIGGFLILEMKSKMWPKWPWKVLHIAKIIHVCLQNNAPFVTSQRCETKTTLNRYTMS